MWSLTPSGYIIACNDMSRQRLFDISEQKTGCSSQPASKLFIQFNNFLV